MGRPREFPDPNDRSINDPSIIVNAADVLGYYNQEKGDDKERVVDSVKQWYKEEANKQGWDSAEFHGNQCVLTAEIERKKKS
ncbi:hypothetical protein C2U71_23120 [Burkholderia ubonensis]|nr:hypothetical protein C2U71_23120 [Burkholderia ubonensis]